ncbi:hypothetical protein [Rhizobium laguerreae]|uniref:hypothetical protein n=1 Tax=Rhizobium laguerreae TaxID=1076926 RepID=UPI001C923343|nr:hypothetical protein [Rhizobium laguerreae]MBY3314753.1 hypothetical protein [Rhizobium laguerreae]
MTEQPRELIPVEQVPALDEEILSPNPSMPVDDDDRLPYRPLDKLIPDDIKEIDPAWDVAQVATRGYVLVARAQALTQSLNSPMLLLLLWCVTSIAAFFVGSAIVAVVAVVLLIFVAVSMMQTTAVFNGSKRVVGILLVMMALVSLGKLPLPGVGIASGRLPEAVRGLFLFDPDNYFDLGGGLKGGPDIAWMGDFRPKPESLSAKDYDALIKATVADVAAYGKEAGKWTSTNALPIKPMVTRPAKALPKYGDRLKDGVVLVPEDFGPVSVLAHTQGQWSINLVAPGGCATVLGPVASGCQNSVTADDPLNANVRRYLADIQPKPAAEQE